MALTASQMAWASPPWSGGEIGEPDVGLDLGSDAREHAHRLHRIVAHRRFSRQHHRVRAVDDGVGHIARLRTRRAGVVHHAFQHLGRGDDRDLLLVAQADDVLLDERHLLRAHLHAQITACHHDPIALRHDRVQLGDGLRLLDLGDHRDIGPALPEERLECLDILRPPHEAERHEVHALRDAELDIPLVLLGERR
jgi:hypothetical protein